MEKPADDLKPIFLRFDDPLMAASLHRNQIRTINVLRGHARVLSNEARSSVLKKLLALGYDEATLDLVTQYLAKTAPLCINFKPELLDKFLTDVCYRNLFEIGTGGGCTNQSMRAGWEKERFMNLYEGAIAFERPKYGSMNVVNDPASNMSARAYGPAHFVLKDHVRLRTTMASGDTAGMVCIGTPDYCLHVVSHFTENELKTCCEIVHNRMVFGKSLEQYRECQYHGELRWDRDFESIALPDTYEGTEWEKRAVEFSAKNGVRLEWYSTGTKNKKDARIHKGKSKP